MSKNDKQCFISNRTTEKHVVCLMQTSSCPTLSSLVSNNTCVDSQFSEVSYLPLPALSKLSEKQLYQNSPLKLSLRKNAFSTSLCVGGYGYT